MNFKEKKVVTKIKITLLIGLLLAGCAFYRADIYYVLFHSINKRRPNILILTICSLIPKYLQASIENEKKFPNLTRFFASANFEGEATPSHPWMPIFYQINKIEEKMLFNGYFPITNPSARSELFFRIPKDRIIGLNQDTNDDLLSIKEGLQLLKDKIFSMKDKTFFLNAFIKYLHFPYWDSKNFSEDILLNGLSPESQKHMKTVLSAPKEIDRAPFFNLLFNDHQFNIDIAKKLNVLHDSSHAHFESRFYFNSDESLLKRWKQNKNFKNDLQVLREVYELKLKFLDSQIGEVLNLWGDPQLQNNTVIMIESDHGQAFMEHNHLLHSTHLYEEFLQIPFAIQLPWTQKKIKSDKQVSKMALVNVVDKIIEGKNSPLDNISPDGDDNLNSEVVSRNCGKTITSIRFKNRWKLIHNYEENSLELYDLSKDPQEINNIYEENLALAEKLKSQMEKRVPYLDKTEGFGSMHSKCFRD